MYLSQYILTHKSDYYLGLRAVTEQGAWEPWILFMLKGIEETARETSSRVQRILSAMHETRELVRSAAPRMYSRELIEVVFQNPYCKIRFLEEAKVAKRQAASAYLQRLAALGVVRPLKVGREIYYVNDALVCILSC